MSYGLAKTVDNLFKDFDHWLSDVDSYSVFAYKEPKYLFEKLKDKYTIKVATPGLKKDDVDIQVNGNVFSLSFKPNPEDKTWQSERSHRASLCGYFSLTRSLPKNVNTDAIVAKMADGVLTVELPLKEDEKPKQIDVLIE